MGRQNGQNGSHAALESAAQLRRQRVSILRAEGMKPRQIQKALLSEGVVNPRTGQAYSLTTIRGDMDGSREVISELIGRVHSEETTLWRNLSNVVTIDNYRTDYRWWDEFRNSKIPEYDIAALFAQPINETVAFYALGTDPIYSLLEDEDVADEQRYYTNQKLKKWVKGHLKQLQMMVSDRNALGDQYVFVNPDASLTIPSPGSVDIQRRLDDPRYIVSVRIENQFYGFIYDERGRKQRVTVRTVDMYTNELLTRDVYLDGKLEPTLGRTWDNIFGFIPMVHFANDRRSNELNGRPIYEQLLPLFAEYNDVFKRGSQGVKLMGNPILAFEGLENINETVSSLKSSLDESWDDDEYAEQTRDAVDMTAGNAIFVPKGNADFKHPAVGFTTDWRAFLKLCFLLICDNRRYMEYMWGAAVEASKASTETQESPFIAFIEGKRIELDGTQEMGADLRMDGMLDLIFTVLVALNFTDPEIYVGKVQSQYQELAAIDEQIKLQKTIYARGQWAINKTRMLELLHIVPDPKKAVQEAEEELSTLPQDDFMTSLNGAARKEMDPTANENAPQSPAGGDNPA